MYYLSKNNTAIKYFLCNELSVNSEKNLILNSYFKKAILTKLILILVAKNFIM